MTVLTVIAALVTAVCVLLFLFPYVIYPLTLHLLSRRPIATLEASSDGAGFALFFCAYNEAKVVPEKLANLRALRARYPKLQIFAYDDASDDGTLELLEAEPDLLSVVVGSGRTGKAHGMKRMVRESSAEFLVFTDANVILDIGCIDELAKHYADLSVGGICGTLRYIASPDVTATESTGGLYWRLEEWSKALESRTGNVMGADGSIFSVRRALYPDFPDTVQDDFTVSMSVVFAGQRLIKAPGVIAYERLVSERADEVRRKVRIAARAFHTHTLLRPGLERMSVRDRYKYVSHKVLRWWGAVPLVVGICSATIFVLSLGLLGLAAISAGLLAGIAARACAPRAVGFVAELVGAVVATFRGVLKARRGETFAVWTPPATR